MGSNFHEDLRPHGERRASPDRQFGLAFAAVFAIVSLWPLRAGAPLRPAVLLLAVLFLALALLYPLLLHPLNRLWMGFGLLLGRIVNPIVTAVLFLLVFTPAGLMARARGKDALRLKRDPHAASYWIPRPAGSNPRDTLAKQF
ncbi:MAG: hypothetical protein JNK48_01465 [Bryobacterales bacterium]|nr:hypothetical protein [Bryobacterales bacterium]